MTDEQPRQAGVAGPAEELDQLRALTTRLEDESANYIARLGPHAKEIAVTTADLLRAGERADMLIEQLRAKFGPVTPSTETAVRSASPAQLKTWTARIITATTLEEFLG